MKKTLQTCLIFFLINILLLIPAVQNWLTKRVEIALEKKLETEVEIERVSLAFLDIGKIVNLEFKMRKVHLH